jgi:hypothetical protein
VAVQGALVRFYCHCRICQRANEAPFGDPVFVWRHRLKVENPAKLEWRRYRATPINLNRGRCGRCGTLIVEHLAASPFSVVIGRTWQDQGLVPPAQGHIFYESRVTDADDDLPKVQGYLASEWAVTRWLMAAMLGRK